MKCSQPSTRWMTVFLALALLIWATLPALIYRSEQNGAPAGGINLASYLSGDGLTPELRQQLGATDVPSIAVNDLLPENAKVLLLGNAAPLYFRDKIVYQTTWDRGPLSNLMRQFADNPTQWARALREQGFTHLLVDPSMLDRWEKSGWNDPLIRGQRVIDFANRFSAIQYQYANGIVIYRLNPN